jgi:hypothetical protein
VEALLLEPLSPLVNSSNNAQNQTAGYSSDFSKYPYITVGSGMGGAMVTRKLITDDENGSANGDLDPTVLILEKAKLQFHTHCLRTSRKHFLHKSQEGRGRDNEVMFDRYLAVSKTTYALKKEPERSICGGCSGFELRGRSLFWSLEAPKHQERSAQALLPP